MRRSTSTVLSSPQKCIDMFPLSFAFSNLLVPKHWIHGIRGVRFHQKLSIMSSATRSHYPFGLYICEFRTIYFLIQARETTNVSARISLHILLRFGKFAIHISSFPFSPHTMSLYMEMEMESHESVSIMKKQSQHKTTGQSLWRVHLSARSELHPHPLAEQAQACGRLTKAEGPGGTDSTCRDHWWLQLGKNAFLTWHWGPC